MRVSRLRYVNDQNPMLPDEIIRRALAERDVKNWRADEMAYKLSERYSQGHATTITEPPQNQSHSQLFSRPHRLGYWMTAVGAMILAGIGGVVNHSTKKPEVSQQAVVTYRTQNGEQAEMTLPDGTIVRLNVGSEIDIPQDFGNSQAGRSVHLRGEAFFHVTHAAGVPFIIQTPTARAVVLGTEFGVRAYDSTAVRVAVRSGRVSLNDVVVEARAIGAADRNSPVLVKRNQDVDAALSFTTGKLVLNRIPLRNAIDDLNRWYDADIHVLNTTYYDEKINVALSTGSINDLVEFLHMLFPATITRNGRIITIS